MKVLLQSVGLLVAAPVLSTAPLVAVGECGPLLSRKEPE